MNIFTMEPLSNRIEIYRSLIVELFKYKFIPYQWAYKTSLNKDLQIRFQYILITTNVTDKKTAEKLLFIL